MGARCHHCGERFPSFDPEVFVWYLKANGWTDKGRRHDVWHVFEKAIGNNPDELMPGFTVELEVPLMTTAPDYAQCVAQLLLNLHRVEERPTSEVVRTLQTIWENM